MKKIYIYSYEFRYETLDKCGVVVFKASTKKGATTLFVRWCEYMKLKIVMYSCKCLFEEGNPDFFYMKEGCA